MFNDRFARALAGEEGFEALRLSEQLNPQRDKTAELIAVRTRFFDSVVLRAAAEGIRQVVILGAGFDSRAFRLEAPIETEFYELDQATVLDSKEEILRREDAGSPRRRVAVPVDLTQTWTTELAAAGFRQERSAWIVEGLLYYMDERGARQLIAGVSKCAVSGSVLGLDLVSASFLISPYTQTALKTMRGGIGWQFGTDDPESFLAEYGWRAKVTQPGDAGASYGRWTSPVVPRVRRELPHTFFVVAERESTVLPTEGG